MLWSARQRHWKTGLRRWLMRCLNWRCWGRRARWFSLLWGGLPSASASFTLGAATKITLFRRRCVLVKPRQRNVVVDLYSHQRSARSDSVGHIVNWIRCSREVNIERPEPSLSVVFQQEACRMSMFMHGASASQAPWALGMGAIKNGRRDFGLYACRV